jgi:hypothetical protein
MRLGHYVLVLIDGNVLVIVSKFSQHDRLRPQKYSFPKRSLSPAAGASIRDRASRMSKKRRGLRAG